MFINVVRLLVIFNVGGSGCEFGLKLEICLVDLSVVGEVNRVVVGVGVSIMGKSDGFFDCFDIFLVGEVVIVVEYLKGVNVGDLRVCFLLLVNLLKVNILFF